MSLIRKIFQFLRNAPGEYLWPSEPVGSMSVWDIFWMNGSVFFPKYREPQHYEGERVWSVLSRLEWEREQALSRLTDLKRYLRPA